MQYIHRNVCIAILALISSCLVTAKDFSYGSHAKSCAEAVAYRDHDLYMDLTSALNNFDATREARIQAALAKLDKDVTSVAKDIAIADAALRRRLTTTLAALAVSHAASAVVSVGVKPGASAVEKQAMNALGQRAGDWRSVFTGYAGNGSVDVTSVAMMPVTFLLAFTPVGAPALLVWEFGTTSIDVAQALGDQQIAGNDSKLTLAIVRERSAALVRKLRMPDLATMNALKNEIDKQCGH